MKRESNKHLYHYCSTRTAYEILKGKTLRMSDITKSNDYDEIYMFFPGILRAIQDQYNDNPFDFKYENRYGEDAIGLLLSREHKIIENLFQTGGLTSFVVCFCENGNLLSQWRGYADDGKGCALGFSERELRDFCARENNLLTLAKVQYKTSKEMDAIIIDAANDILNNLRCVRNNIETELKVFAEKGKTDVVIAFLFHRWIVNVIINSLKYKNVAYKEEHEWRLYFNKNVKEDIELLFGDAEIDTLNNDDLIKTLRNKIDFNVKDMNIVPFFPIDIFELSKKPIKDIYLGPKNIITDNDFYLMMAKFGYERITMKRSCISYRSCM